MGVVVRGALKHTRALNLPDLNVFPFTPCIWHFVTPFMFPGCLRSLMGSLTRLHLYTKFGIRRMVGIFLI